MTEPATDAELLRFLTQETFRSHSQLRVLDEGYVYTLPQLALNTDANLHVLMVCELAVKYGDLPSVALLQHVASALKDPGRWPDRQADAVLATKVLAKVPLNVAIEARTVPKRTPQSGSPFAPLT